MTPEIAFTFFDKLLDVLGLIKASTTAKRIDKDAALNAIIAAIQPTQKYIRDRTQGKKRDTEIEDAISNSWRNASVPVSKVDIELGRVCWDKGGYWMNPDIWTDEMIAAKGIGIAKVEERALTLLGSVA